jgi:glycosyltransferase involved in cell wall biosynthesis
MSKKICMIFLRHSALDCRIYYKEARSLVNAGYDVHLLGRLKDNAFTDMGGNPVGYPDKDGVWQHEGLTFHGIRKRNGIFGKWIEYKDLVREGLSLNADVYHCHESDIALAAAVKIKKVLGKKTRLVFDSHEFWAGSWAYSLMGARYRIIWPLTSIIEKAFLKHTDYLITADIPTAGILQLYDLNKKVAIIYNSPVIHSICSDQQQSIAPPQLNKGKVVLCHEGTLSNSRKVDTIVGIIEQLKDICVLYVIGGIYTSNDNLNLRIKKLKNEGHIIDVGWVPYESVYSALQPAQIGLSLLADHPNYVTATPNKLFNYMSIGIPVITDDYPGMRNIIQQCKCGILVGDSTLENYIAAIKYLINNPHEAKAMGQRGKIAIVNELSWENQGKKLLEIYRELIDDKPFYTF